MMISSFRLRRLPASAALALSAWLLPTSSPAQQACYVPGSGTLYLTMAPNTPSACRPGHLSATFGQSVGGPLFAKGGNGNGGGNGGGGGGGEIPTLPTNEAGAFDFGNVNGLVATGTIETGNIPASGAGTRLMWYPAKAAFRAGSVYGTLWDEGNIGIGSFAAGTMVQASGDLSVAIGGNTTATGFAAVAIGASSTASGYGAVALGTATYATGANATSLGGSTSASGVASLATGSATVASGDYSTAMGRRAWTNGKSGAFVYGDASSLNNEVAAVVDNQFVVRAQQFWFGTNNLVTAPAGRFIQTSTGAYLTTGGTWTNSSDSTKKHNWREVDAEDVLARIAAMPVRTWSYVDEDSAVRHMGPTAQDFRAAFGLGDTDKAIATVDADGVALAGIKALVDRTVVLQQENAGLRAALAEVMARLAALENRR